LIGATSVQHISIGTRNKIAVDGPVPAMKLTRTVVWMGLVKVCVSVQKRKRTADAFSKK